MLLGDPKTRFLAAAYRVMADPRGTNGLWSFSRPGDASHFKQTARECLMCPPR